MLVSVRVCGMAVLRHARNRVWCCHPGTRSVAWPGCLALPAKVFACNQRNDRCSRAATLREGVHLHFLRTGALNQPFKTRRQLAAFASLHTRRFWNDGPACAVRRAQRQLLALGLRWQHTGAMHAWNHASIWSTLPLLSPFNSCLNDAQTHAALLYACISQAAAHRSTPRRHAAPAPATKPPTCRCVAASDALAAGLHTQRAAHMLPSWQCQA